MDNNSPSNQPVDPPQPPTEPATPPSTPKPANMEKVGEHALSNAELSLFAEIYQSFERIRLLVAVYLCEKQGYPEKEPVAFQFNWKNRTVSAFRPPNAPATSNIETTGDLPSATPPPAQNKTP